MAHSLSTFCTGSRRPAHRRGAAPDLSLWLAIAAGLLALIGLGIISQGSVPSFSRLPTLLTLLVREGSTTLFWLAAAAGYGWLLRRVLRQFTAGDSAVDLGDLGQLVFGAAILMLIDWLLGCLGALNSVTVWVISGFGWALLSSQLTGMNRDSASDWGTVSPLILAAMPALGLMLGACAIAPGVLWPEMSYPVLERHLQLPREWMQAGRITGLDHNIHSYLPNLVEAAYLHLGWWAGSMHRAVYACQMLHTAMALIAALGMSQLLAKQAGSGGGAAAGVFYLTIPWTFLTGSMAADDQVVMALGAIALGMTLPSPGETAQPGRRSLMVRGSHIGFLCGAAALVNLNALGMILLPIFILLLITGRGRICWGSFLLAALLVLMCWMARNQIWIGQPFYPVAMPPPIASPIEGFALLLRDRFSITEFGYAIFPAAAAGVVVGLSRPPLRRFTLLMLLLVAVRLLAWLLLSDHAARQLIPLLTPLVLLAGIAVVGMTDRRLGAAVALVAALIGSAIAAGLYLRQHSGTSAYAIDGVPLMKRLDANRQSFTPAALANALSGPVKIYAEGFSAPFYIDAAIDYRTDRVPSPLASPLSQSPSAALRWLKQEGYTHVLIDWNRLPPSPSTGPPSAGVIDPGRLRALAESLLQPIGRWQDQVLYLVR